MKYFWSLCLCCTLLSCEFKRLDTKQMKEQMQNQQIRHVTNNQLSNLVAEQGEKVSRALQQERAFASPAYVDSLAKANGVTITFVPDSSLGNASAEPKIREVFAAYQYSAQQNLPQESNFQQLDGGKEWLYTSPVVMQPSFQSKGVFANKKEGNFVGIWSVYFSRKELIRRADPKEFKKQEKR